MEVTVTFRNMEPIESLHAYADDKISKLKKYMDKPIEAHIVLSVEKFRHQADITFSMDGTVIKAIEETENMYSAIDKVIDKIETQVKKHLSKKFRARRVNSHHNSGVYDVEEDVSDDADEFEIEIEKLDAKPMSMEEAAMQLTLYPKQKFLVFRNSLTNEINVIYKRSSSKLGLIEPAV